LIFSAVEPLSEGLKHPNDLNTCRLFTVPSFGVNFAFVRFVTVEQLSVGANDGRTVKQYWARRRFTVVIAALVADSAVDKT
jgi:hypothetical protein